MVIYVCINSFTKVDQVIIDWTMTMNHEHRLQLPFEEIRWVKQALYKQNEMRKQYCTVKLIKWAKQAVYCTDAMNIKHYL